jgi:hypothetical protein
VKISSLTNAIRRVGVEGGRVDGGAHHLLSLPLPSLSGLVWAWRSSVSTGPRSGIAISVQTGTEALDPTVRHQTHYSLYYQPTELSTKKLLPQLQESVMAFGSCCCCCHNYCCCCVAFATAPHKSCVTPRLHTTVSATTIATATAYSEAGSSSTRLSFFDGL